MKNITKIILFFTVITLIVLFSFCNEKTTKETNESQTETQAETLPSVDTTDRTNDFYDNEKTHSLPVKTIKVEGEIANPGEVDFSNLPLRSVIVRETVLDGDTNRFVGAYRYDGYSLYDILNRRKLQKANQEEFPPIIDLYVEVSNENGEKALISWGELFYPIHRHEIIIATQVMQIVPSKSKDYWPLPKEGKLIVASDLFTERNISNPTSITVKSLKHKYEINRDLAPLYAPELHIKLQDTEVETLTALPGNIQIVEYPSVFYGRGRGIHGVTVFRGILLKDLMGKYVEINKENIQTGMFTIAGIDGYRGAFTFSELFNRNDQSEILLMTDKTSHRKGKFSLYVSADFFSDRAIKAMSEIRFDKM